MELISFLSKSLTQRRRGAEYAEFFGAAFGRGQESVVRSWSLELEEGVRGQ